MVVYTHCTQIQNIRSGTDGWLKLVLLLIVMVRPTKQSVNIHNHRIKNHIKYEIHTIAHTGRDLQRHKRTSYIIRTRIMHTPHTGKNQLDQPSIPKNVENNGTIIIYARQTDENSRSVGISQWGIASAER